MNQEQKEFLEAFKIKGDIDKNAIPIFNYDGESTPEFLEGYACIGGDARRHFIAEAPEGLWLGGGAGLITVPQGVVSIPDRRHGGNLGPTAQGWAKYSEGHDLRQAAERELFEEITCYVLGGEGDNLYQQCMEIVPAGVSAKGRADGLNLEFDDVKVFGSIDPVYDGDPYVYHYDDRALIWIGHWDLSNLENVERLRIVWEDDFPKGLRPGTNPRVIDRQTKLVVGSYEGAQGYIPNNSKFHTALDVGMNLISIT